MILIKHTYLTEIKKIINITIVTNVGNLAVFFKVKYLLNKCTKFANISCIQR